MDTANTTEATASGYENHHTVRRKASEIMTTPSRPEPMNSAHVTIATPIMSAVSVQITMVPMNGSNNATSPSVAG